MALLLEALYEQDVYEGSYGFRQGRRPHDALHERRERCLRDNSGWIVEAAVSGYFDSLLGQQLVIGVQPSSGHEASDVRGTVTRPARPSAMGQAKSRQKGKTYA